MLEGKMGHEDFAGHAGEIGPGDLQWMTAGRGIVHSEVPGKEGEAHGLQLWVNLPRKHKLCKPAYQELLDKDIPKVEVDGVKATVIAGEAFGVSSPVMTRTPTAYLDFKLEAGSVLEQPLPKGWNGFVYTIAGSGKFGPEGSVTEAEAHHTLVMSAEGEEDGLRVEAGSDGLHMVLIAGKPNGSEEPIVQYGPFVMNTEEEIMEAMRDFQLGINGFEGARAFHSSIAKEIGH
jgi:hypothetical protein